MAFNFLGVTTPTETSESTLQEVSESTPPEGGQNGAITLGCWPVTPGGTLAGFATGVLAMPPIFDSGSKVPVDQLYVCVPNQLIMQTLIHVPDENAVVDFTYGNREVLRSYLYSQMHQQDGRPAQYDHSFILEEALRGDCFFLHLFTIPDSVLAPVERLLECVDVVFQKTSESNLSFHNSRQPGDELLKITFDELLKSKSLHERITKSKPDSSRRAACVQEAATAAQGGDIGGGGGGGGGVVAPPSAERLKAYKEELEQYVAKKLSEFDDDAAFRKKQSKKHGSREGYESFLRQKMRAKLESYGAL